MSSRNPQLSVGCHVLLVDAFPVLELDKVSSLALANSGVPKFRDSLVRFACVAASRRLNEDEIEAEITRRLSHGKLFATCYADLDHFKEFNDRYSYHEGDRVIRILAKILHDVVKGLCLDEGFVGHIGGDDFIFIIPVASVNEACSEIVEVFDTLIP